MKKSCRRDEKTWVEKKGTEAQQAVDKNDLRSMYRVVQELTGVRTSNKIPIKNKAGKVLLNEEAQNKRWVEHFKEVLNRSIPNNTYDLSKDTPKTLNICMGKIKVAEVTAAIKSLKNNKSAGIDDIPAELLKYGKNVLAKWLVNFFNEIWHKEEMPTEWTKGVIVKLPKKCYLGDCNNWRGITLLSVPGKVFCKVLLNRLQTQVDRNLREEQAGFRSERSCSEQIFTLRNIIEQTIEFQKSAIVNFIDFQKAFDSVHRPILWKILASYGIPEKYINILKALYKSSSCCIKTANGHTEYFEIMSGLRQGCILSPFLFTIVIDFVMKRAMDQVGFGISWGQTRLTDLDFADDIALIAEEDGTMQRMTTRLEEHAAKVGLYISNNKSKVIRVGRYQNTQPITVEQKPLEEVSYFPYLGSYLSENGDIEIDVNTRLGKAAAVFQRLQRIWKTRSIGLRSKLLLYTSIVVSTAIYGSETWKNTEKIARKLDKFQQRCLRRTLRITWRDHITNAEVLHRTNQLPLRNLVTTRRLRFASHVLRLHTSRPARQAIEWSPPDGKRKQGKPKKTWRSTFKEDLQERGIIWEERIRLAQDRIRWRTLAARCPTRDQRI